MDHPGDTTSGRVGFNGPRRSDLKMCPICKTGFSVMSSHKQTKRHKQAVREQKAEQKRAAKLYEEAKAKEKELE